MNRVQTRYLRALIAVLFVSGIAGATFFVANRLSTSQSVAPNAPESEPQAFSTTIRNGIRLPDEDIRDIQRTTTPKSSAPVVGRSDERDYVPETAPTQYVGFQTPASISNGAGQSTQAQTQNPASPTSAPDNQANYQTPTSGTNYPSSRPPTAPTPTNSPTPNAPEPTPKPGEYGSSAPAEKRKDTNSYMSDANNPCTDGLGFISGTGCFNGVRKVLNIPETQRAYQEHVNKAQDKIFSASDAQLIDLAYSGNSGNKCAPGDIACSNCKENNACLIKLGQDRLFQQNLIIELDDKERISKEIVKRDVLNFTTDQLNNKYNNTDRAQILAANNINDPTLSKAGAILSLYNDPTKPTSNMIAIICGSNTSCSSGLQYSSREQLLKLGVGNSITSESVTKIIEGNKNTTNAQKYVDLFLDPSKSDSRKIEEYCEDIKVDRTTCLKNIDVNELATTYAAKLNIEPANLIQLKKDYSNQRIIADPNYDLADLKKIFCTSKDKVCNTTTILDKVVDQNTKSTAQDSIFLKFYTDIQNSPTEIRDLYCGNNSKCKSEYSTENFLASIKNPEIKQQAIDNRNQQLFQYIVPLASNQRVDIDNETKKEVQKFNTDYQHAYWAYWKEQTKKQNLTASTVDNDKLGEDFYKLFASNPSEFNRLLSQYKANPMLFTDLQTATAFKANTDVNSSIIALSNQAIKNTTIEGLTKDGKAVVWDNADEIYKVKAMAKSCQEGASILSTNECKSLNNIINNIDNLNNLSESEAGLINSLGTGLLAKKFGESKNPQLYLQEVFNTEVKTNMPSSFYSNTVAIDNFTVPQEIREKAIQQAKDEITKNIAMQGQGTTNPRAIASQQYQIQNLNNTDFLNGNLPITNLNINTKDLVTEKLDQMTVTETYTRGGGMAASLTAAGLATTACAALGPPGIAISLGCGAVAGLAGVVATYVPIWGTVTAEEMATEQQALKDFKVADIFDNPIGQALIQSSSTLNNSGGFMISPDWQGFVDKYGDFQPLGSDAVAGTVQSLYKSQGAYCDTAEGSSIGGSCTRKDNPYANYQSMLNTYGQYGANLNTLSDTNFVNQLAIQGTLNQQFDALQRENQKQAIANIIVAPIIGAASGGIGGKLAQSSAAIKNASYTQALLRQQANDWALWLPGSAVGTLQNYAQFDATTGFIDTQAEIDLEICIREKGRDKCSDKQTIVDDETKDAMWTTLAQGFLTDAALQVGQSGFSFATEYAKIPQQNTNTPPPNTDTATTNIISPPTTTDTPNTTPTSNLSNGIKDTLIEITSNQNVLETNTYSSEGNVSETNTAKLVEKVSNNNNNDLVEKKFIITILENNKELSGAFFKNPTKENFEKFIASINESTKTLAPQFDGNEDAAKLAIIETLQIIETRENLSGRLPHEIDALINATRVQAGVYRPTAGGTPSQYANATPVDPFTEAVGRLISSRSKSEADITIEEVKSLIEDLTLTEERIAIVHGLQTRPEFQDAVKQVTNTLSQAEASKKTILNPDIAGLFEETSNRIVIELTSDLAKKLSPSNTVQQTAAAPQPNTPPPPIPPAKPIANTNDDQATIITPTRPKLTREQTNRLVEIYIKEIDSFGSRKFANETERMDAYNNIIGKYIEYGLVFDLSGRTNSTQPLIPNGYGVTNIALIRLKNRFKTPGELVRLTPTQQAEISNLITAVDTTTDSQRAVFQRILDERVNSLLNGETDTNLPGTATNPNTTPVTYENMISLPKEAFTESQLNGIDNLIKIINNTNSPKLKESAIRALKQIVNEYTNSTPQVNLISEGTMTRLVNSIKNFFSNINEIGGVTIGTKPNGPTKVIKGPLGIEVVVADKPQTINTKNTLESAIQKTYSPEERADLLKAMGVKQTEAELLANPTPHSVLAIKNFFLKPDANGQKITQTELMKALIESDLIQVVIHDRDLFFELERQILETTNFTYSELKSGKYGDQVVFDIYKKLQEKTGLTPMDIFSKYKLQNLVVQADPKFIFEEIFGTYDYEVFKKRFPNDDFDEEWLQAGANFAQKEFNSEYGMSDGYIDIGIVNIIFKEMLNTPDEVIAKFPLYYTDPLKTPTNNPFGIGTLKNSFSIFDQTVGEMVYLNTIKIESNTYLVKAYLEDYLDPKVNYFLNRAYLLNEYTNGFRNKITKAVEEMISNTTSSKNAKQQDNTITSTSEIEKTTPNQTGEENTGLKQIKTQRLVESYELLVEKGARYDYIKELKAKISWMLGKDVDIYSSSFINPDFKNPWDNYYNLRSTSSLNLESKYLPWIPRFAGLIHGFMAGITVSMELDILPDPLIEFFFGSDNNSIDISTGGIAPKTITPPPSPTLTPTPTKTINFPLTNSEMNKTSDIINTYDAIVACEQNKEAYIKNNLHLGSPMKDCFCEKTGGCPEDSLNEQIATQVNYFYNNNLTYETSNLIFLIAPLIDVEITNSPNTCQENRICNEKNEVKYAICNIDKAERVYPGDIIIDNTGTIQFCPNPWGQNQEGTLIICNNNYQIDKEINSIKKQTLEIKTNEIKEVWRSNTYQENNSCWTD